MSDPGNVSPDPRDLFAQFPPADDFPDYEIVPPEAVPPPFRQLLVHEEHMTVTMEAYHGDLVDVHPLAVRHQGSTYSRKIILTLQKSGKVVLFGIVRVQLSACSEEVASAIVAGKTPFGRILIEHDVMRRIEPTAYLRVEPGPKQLAWFGLEQPQPMYGRVAYIHCNDLEAVELLEVVIA